MNLRALKTVFFKEVLENARDKRTVMSSIVMGALFGPILMVIIILMVMNIIKIRKFGLNIDERGYS